MKSHLTAISRRRPSLPMAWLAGRGLLRGRILDYGCGRGFDCAYFNTEGFDPYYRPDPPAGPFDTITCNYVLNVLPEADRGAVIESIRGLLRLGGIAYLAVRMDVQRPGYTSRGTFQEIVTLDLPVVKQTAGYRIYRLEA